ncbi:hypothetical protein CC78DRAFT_572740 [Lojkania enalia]|uniref:Uncharacterized protein n=1 Tax=Lojkania enalia TaxID=147567 RepID=A0A9P4MY25_9PLEO|nr:hypothetical protein CC78DRAFT_572740 [Didymosphaeria enalia]
MLPSRFSDTRVVNAAYHDERGKYVRRCGSRCGRESTGRKGDFFVLEVQANDRTVLVHVRRTHRGKKEDYGDLPPGLVSVDVGKTSSFVRWAAALCDVRIYVGGRPRTGSRLRQRECVRERDGAARELQRDETGLADETRRGCCRSARGARGAGAQKRQWSGDRRSEKCKSVRKSHAPKYLRPRDPGMLVGLLAAEAMALGALDRRRVFLLRDPRHRQTAAERRGWPPAAQRALVQTPEATYIVVLSSHLVMHPRRTGTKAMGKGAARSCTTSAAAAATGGTETRARRPRNGNAWRHLSACALGVPRMLPTWAVDNGIMPVGVAVVHARLTAHRLTASIAGQAFAHWPLRRRR